MDRHSTVANLSCMPSQITEMSARVAGVHLRQVSGSAGNVCSFQLRDGLTYATVGQLYDSKGQSNGYHKLPYVRATSGLYAQATGSATGTSWACYYVEDEESGTVSDTPSLMFESTSLVPTIGSATVAATRSTTVTALDNTPALKTAQINEIGVPGARRVRNLFALSDAPATQNVTTTAETYVLQASGTGTITLSGTYVGSLVVAGNRKRLAFTATAGTLTLTLSGGTPTWVQLERTTGAADTTLPSEYVSTSLAAPWHGAGVLDVKYFTTANGCTVDGSDVVTEATGAALTGVKGVLVEPAVTELITATYYRDLTAWTTISGVPVVSSNSTVGIDGLTLADTLTGDGAGTTGKYVAVTLSATTTYVLQSVLKAGTSTSSTFGVWDVTAGAYVASVTVSWTAGVPSTSASSGATAISYTLIANGFYKIAFQLTTGANTSHRIYLLPDTTGTSKSIIHDWSSMALESFATSLRPGVSRTATSLSMATPAFMTSGAAWSYIQKLYPLFNGSDSKGGFPNFLAIYTNGSNQLLVYTASSSSTIKMKLVVGGVTKFDQGGTVSYLANAILKIGVIYSPVSGYSLFANGALVSSHANTTTLVGDTVYPGTLTGYPIGQIVKEQKFYASALPAARMILETT